MHKSLLNRQHIITSTPAAYVFEDEDGTELAKPVRGHLAVKEIDDNPQKYFINEENLSKLPIRVNSYDEMYFKDSTKKRSVILYPRDVTPFKIVPERCFATEREFIDTLAPFRHSSPDTWTLMKIVAVMGMVGKTFLGICSQSEFGKSSIFEAIDALTKRCPVFQPRSEVMKSV